MTSSTPKISKPPENGLRTSGSIAKTRGKGMDEASVKVRRGRKHKVKK
jgi:hypothetical protein